MHEVWWVAAALFVSGFIAGLFDSIVGGGGVVTLPALLWAGLPPYMALGTNKFAGTFASSVSTVAYVRSGHVERLLLSVMIPATFVGALIGANSVLYVDQAYLKFIIFIVILGIAILTLLRRELGRHNQFPGVTRGTVFPALFFAFGLGFYDGFIGPGTGSFLLFGFLSLFRFDFITAAGNGRMLNFTSNAAALLLFAFRGKVVAVAGLPMAAGMLVGARAGSRLAVRRGVPLIRPLFVAVALILAVKTGLSLFVP